MSRTHSRFKGAGRGALIVVDVQVDFCPGGALAVKGGDKIVPRLNQVVQAATKAGLPVFFTRDWHPIDHISFKAQGGPWPPHCIQESSGAMFHLLLKVPDDAIIVSKGKDPKAEAYSGFQGTDLAKRLRALGVDHLIIGGLATDYCVKETAKDGLKEGFSIEIIEDCVKPVDLRKGDGKIALAELRKAGVSFTDSDGLIRRFRGPG